MGVLRLGDFSIFVADTVRSLSRLWVRRHLLLRHCEFIGVSSWGIIVVAAIFLGAVLGYQLYVAFHYFGAEDLMGASVGLTLYRELAPSMAAIMVTGRAGAAIAAELASMRVSEQIDALEVMAIDPIEYLVTPRVVAGFLMMPLLAMLFCLVASLSAAFVGCGILGLSSATFWYQYARVVDPVEILHCTTKGFWFGGVLTWVACYCGFNARGGAKGVGHATRTTVVASCLAILLVDYILTSLLPFGSTKLKAP